MVANSHKFWLSQIDKNVLIDEQLNANFFDKFADSFDDLSWDSIVATPMMKVLIVVNN